LGIRRFAMACMLLPFLGAAATAESFDAAQRNIDQKLERALAELSSARKRIAKEKIPLSRAVSKLEDDVHRLSREQERLVKIEDTHTIDLASLRRQVESLEAEEEFIESRLNEFVRDFEGRLDLSELSRYEQATSAARLASKNVNLDALGKRTTQLDVVEAALARLDAQLGGEIFAGEALSPQGVLLPGRFVALGPTVFFVSDDGSVTGISETQLNAADPVVVPLPGGLGRALPQLAETGSGELPLDSTLGKALKIERAAKGVSEYVAEGGVVGYVIIVLGAAALLLTFFKGYEIHGFPVAEPEQVDVVLEELARGDHEAAARQAQQMKGTSGEMLTTGVEHVREGRGVLEELLFEKILRVRPSLERFLPFLAITAAAAPLLGLLGTVIGMIKTFQLITIFGTGDAKSLSSGISEALVTTALGLIVAIPTLVLHGVLTRMAKHKLGLLEQISAAFLNGVSSLRGEASRGGPASTEPAG
jgi:biopolymer transport protein ExbB